MSSYQNKVMRRDGRDVRSDQRQSRPTENTVGYMEHMVRSNRLTEDITSHAAAAIPVRLGHRGLVEFLLVPYTMQFEGLPPETTTLRCFMETQSDAFPDGTLESPTDTIDRCVREEMMDGDQNPLSIKWDFWPIKPICLARLAECDKRGGRHMKFFRMIVVERGDLRESVLVEKGIVHGTSTEETLGPPRWVEAGEALESMRRSKPIHLQAAASALWKLVNENPELADVARRYGTTVERSCRELFHGEGPIRVHDNDLDLIVKYIKSFKN
jgi:hypothetical protein